MKKTFMYLLALAVVGLQAFSCEVSDLDREDDPSVEVTPEDPDPEPAEVYYVKVEENLSDWSAPRF